jgi:hypothetical protein
MDTRSGSRGTVRRTDLPHSRYVVCPIRRAWTSATIHPTRVHLRSTCARARPCSPLPPPVRVERGRADSTHSSAPRGSSNARLSP